MRQLSRRNPRRAGRARHSMASDAAIFGQDNDQKSIHLSGGRSRSLSGSSAILLKRHPVSDHRRSSGLDSISVPGSGHNRRGSGSIPYTPTTPGEAGTFPYVSGGHAGQGASPGGNVNLKSAEAAGPYYRPPRARRATMDPYSPGSRSRASWASGDWTNIPPSQQSPDPEGPQDPMEGPSVSGRATPLPAHLGTSRDLLDSNVDDARNSKTDYAIREVDFYYRVRGPALSNLPTRRLKTGPADPTGPVSSATGWIKSLFGGKTKDKGKGFEVVRSSRVPPHGAPAGESPLVDQVPYSDDPGIEAHERTRDLELSDEGDAVGGGTRRMPDEESASPLSSEGEDGDSFASDEENLTALRASQISQFPPSLPAINTVGGIELPSRIASKASSKPSRSSIRDSRKRPPAVPRKSSKRTSSQGHIDFDPKSISRLSAIASSPPSSPRVARIDVDRSNQQHLQPSGSIHQRLPFGSGSSSPMADRLSTGAESSNSSILPSGIENVELGSIHGRHSSSVLGTYAPGIRDDRPSSMGYVQQHRASDNIHTPNPGGQTFLGSAAELVDDSAPPGINTRTQAPHPP